MGNIVMGSPRAPLRPQRLELPEPASIEDMTDPAPDHSTVEAVLEAIRPSIKADGGDVELVGITDGGIVQVRLLGACVGCPSSHMTLRDGLEANLVGRIPGVNGVEAVKDD